MSALCRDARTALGVAALAITSLLIAAPVAFGFGLTPSVQPQTAAAGSNTDLGIGLQIQQPEQDLKDLTIHLPPGLVGNPQVAAQCTAAQLNADSCPGTSDVGDVSNGVTLTQLNILNALPIPLALSQTVSGDVYNMVPQTGEPARFGIVLRASPINLPVLGSVLLPPIILQSPASLRQSDLGLDTVLNNLPNQATVIQGLATADLNINSVNLTLKGKVNGGLGFIRFPTSCRQHTVGFDASSYTGGPASGQATFTTTGCANEPFSPGFKAKLKPMGRNGLRPELTTTITQTIQEAGLQRAQVILPHDLGADNAVLGNQCPQAQFAAGSCPQNTIIGSAVAQSPLQSQALTGPVALLVPPTPGLPQVGLDLRGPLALKLKGDFVFTSAGTGVVFDGLPDIPISNFQLTFNGGDSGLVLASRQVCDPPPLTFATSFLSHSGASTTGSTAATVDGTCKGGGGKGGKKPKAKVKLGALGSDEPRMSFKVTAGSEKLRSAKLKLPKQLRFAAGKSFDHGSSFGSKTSVKHTKGGLSIKARKPTQRLRGKVAKGALVPGKGLKAAKGLKFKFSVRDVAGKTTKLTVRAK
jgi:hypothetical protein